MLAVGDRGKRAPPLNRSILDPAGAVEEGAPGSPSKIPALRDALTAFFTGHHAIIIGEILAKLDYLDEAIDRLSVEIDRVISPFGREVALLTRSPGSTAAWPNASSPRSAST